MGVYYKIANLDRREVLNSPHASKEFEWNHPRNPSSSVVLWALFHRWSGDRVEVVNDAGGYDEHPAYTECWPNVWSTVEIDYLSALKGRGMSLEGKGESCPHGYLWQHAGKCEECFPKVSP
jgi:hypothetical protein